ncbi:MAG: glycosyltransferase family 39 protein [Chloroflexota bacterium]|nr:glycosyltransferase family 39 protein [Chloroflexota bacterium]
MFAIAVLLRLPFTAHLLFAWDSVLYARAMEHFRVALAPLESRPHPPGYLFYVLSARGGAALTGDANAGLVLVSIIGGALACAAGYAIAVRLAGPRVAAVAAALLLASPLLWQYSEVAYPYALLALLAGAVGFALWEARNGGLAARVVASAAFGLAAGFRQDLFVILGPLWLVAAASGGTRALLASAAAVAIASLAWLVPSGLASGGIDTYLGLSIAEAAGSGIAQGTTQYGRDLALTAIGLGAQLLLATPLIFLGAWSMVRGWHRELAPLLLLWIAPALLLYVAVHIGSWPYTLSVAIPLSILAALGAEAVVRAAGPLARAVIAVGLAAVIALNGVYFLLGDGHFTASEIRVHDRALAERVGAVRARFSPREAALLAEPGYLLAVHYLPEYTAVLVTTRPDPEPKRIVLPSAVRFAVVFDDELRLAEGLPIERVRLSDVSLRVIALDPGAQLVLTDGALSRAPP